MIPRNTVASGKITDTETDTSTVTDQVQNGNNVDDSSATETRTSHRNLRERKKSLPSNQDTDNSSNKDNEIYEVDQILSMKTVRGKRKFLIKWKGFDSDHDSWEPEENLSGSRQLVAEYVKVNKSNSGKTDERPTRSSTSRTHARKILLKRSCNTKKGKVDYAEKNEDEKVEPAMKRPRRGTRESKGSVASAEHIKDSDAQVEPDNEIFEVDRILSMKTVRGKRKFLVKWKGFDSDHDSWEPEENLSGSRQLVAEYVKENSQLSVAASQDLANNLQQDHPDSNHVDSPVDTNGSDIKKEDSHDETSDTGDSLKIESTDNKTTLNSPSAEESGIASDEDAINRQPQKCEKCEVSKSKIPARHNVNFTRMFFDYRDKTIRYVGIDQNTKKLHNYTLTEAYSADAWSLVCFFHSKVSSTSSGKGEINI